MAAPRDAITLLRSISPYLLAALCFLGAFSRFTHGKYTPWWYEFQEYHAPDDGSTVARVTPVMDVILGTLILWRPTRPLACLLSSFFLGMGLGIQLHAGKSFGLDLVLIAIGNAATWAAWGDRARRS